MIEWNRSAVGERIVLGLGNNVDYEITWDSEVIERLIGGYQIASTELSPDVPIASPRDLLVSILGFLSNGTGGERSVASLAIIDEFASHFQKRITVGGTGMRAAMAMEKLGYRSALHLVTVNDIVRQVIPHGCPWVCSNNAETIYPHLIVQFPNDTRILAGSVNIHGKHANRVIYVNDRDNLRMRISPELASMASDAGVFLVSGFNAMQRSDLLTSRLATLRRIVQSLPADAIVFYEDACFHHFELAIQARDTFLDLVNIYSMNEDEWQAYLGREVALLDPLAVYQALRDVRRLIPVPLLVVHTRHWALAFGDEAVRYADALRAGVLMASTRLRLGDDFLRGDYLATERLPAIRESVEFAAELTRLAGDCICCSPSLEVGADTATTVGLGDAFVGGLLPALLDK